MRSGSGCINIIGCTRRPNRPVIATRSSYGTEKNVSTGKNRRRARGLRGPVAFGATALRRYGATALRRYGATALRRWHPQPFGTGARLDKTWSEAP